MLWLAGLAALLAAGYRLIRARAHLTPGVAYLSGAIGALGLGAVVLAPGTLAVTGPIEPFPNATRLVGNSLTMVAAWCVQALLLHSVLDPAAVSRAIRRHAAVLVAAIAGMSILLTTASVPSHPDFVAANTTVPGVLGYLLILCAYIAFIAATTARLMRRYIRLTDRPWVRRGFVLTQAGAVIGVGWAVSKALFALVVFSTGARLTSETAVSAILSGVSVALIAIGATMPTWAPALTKTVRWIQHHRSCRTLAPLVQALHETLPELAYKARAPEDERDADWKLPERLADVQDGLLLLAPYRPSEPPTAAQHASDRDPEARAEATAIAEALRARRAGNPPATSVPPAPTHQAQGLEGETAWLCRVARAYRRVPTPASHDRTSAK